MENTCSYAKTVAIRRRLQSCVQLAHAILSLSGDPLVRGHSGSGSKTRKKKRPPRRPLSHLRTLVFVVAGRLGLIVRRARLVRTGLLVLVDAPGGVLVVVGGGSV